VEHESVRRGPQHLVAKVASGPRSGVVIEELDVDVPTGDGWSCYAVLGAAPLHVEEVIYEREERRSAAPRLREPKDESLAGSAWTGRPRVDFAFEKAPDRLDLPKGASSMIRHRAFLAEGGWHAAVEALYANKDVKGGVALARRVALAELDESAIDWAGGLADEDGLAGIAAHAEKVLALAPDSVRAHRQRQDALCELGRRDDLVGEYRKRFEKQPTATNGYLYARLLRTAEALPLLGKLVGENPDHVWLRRSLAWNHQQGLRFSDAAAQYEKLASLDAAMGRESLRNRAQALVGAGRVAEAQRLVRAVIDKESKEENVLYGRIARVPGAAVDLPPGLALLPLLFERVTPGLQVEYLARIRDVEAFRRRKDEIEEVPYREASDLEVLSFREPGTAAEAARGVTEESLGMLDDLARLTLACELAYRRNEGLAKLVMEKRRPYGLDLPVATLREPAAFLGTVDAEESDLEAQAVLAYAASRRAQDPGERQRWLDFALARDVFRVVVPR
jgi:tetratricopeptide (TPR) repeat protein